MSSVRIFDEHYHRYDRWFDENREVFEAEVRALRALLPTRAAALEVGAGTGRFAVALSFAYAVEPSRNMALAAKSRGVCVCQALGESLPYPSAAFDSVSLITVLCFVENSRAIIDECRRVLRPGGHLLIGMIDKHSTLGAFYESRSAADVFYRAASLHSMENMINLVENAGLRVLRCVQTLIGMPYETPGWDDLRTGFGEGAFGAMLVRKPDA